MSEIKVTQVKVRLPSELKAFIETEAVRNQSSMGSEVVRAVRERMDRVGAESLGQIRASFGPSNESEGRAE